MFKRHDIRIKAVQVIYSNDICNTKPNEKGVPQALKLYQIILNEAEGLRFFLVDIILQIVDEVKRAAEAEAKKILAQNVHPIKSKNKLEQNPVVLVLRTIYDSYSLQTKQKKIKIDDHDLIRQLFASLINTPIYQEYTTVEQENDEMKIAVVVAILKEVVQHNEVVESFIEDHFMNAMEDASSALFSLVEQIRNYPKIKIETLADVEENIAFGRVLIESCLAKTEFIEKVITEKIQHWDNDRIIVLDKAILKLAVCEFLYFDAIPITVSLNEYIEISKEYSTIESKKFINGVLDTLQQKLRNDGKIGAEKRASTNLSF